MTLFTANVVTFFIGGEEARNRESLQQDIVTLRADIERLLDAEELRLTLELHQEIRALRAEIATLRNELRGQRATGAPDGN
jgi:cell division protein FtsB